MIILNKEQAKEMKFALKSGLIVNGVDFYNEIEFMGTNKQWDKFEELKKLNNL